jgi:hypothetical protein
VAPEETVERCFGSHISGWVTKESLRNVMAVVDGDDLPHHLGHIGSRIELTCVNNGLHEGENA